MKSNTLSVSHKSRLSNLSRLYHDKQLPTTLTHDNMLWIDKDKEKVVTMIYINYSNANTILSYLSTLKFMCNALNYKDAHTYYTTIFDKLKLKQNEIIDKNLMTDKQRDKYINWKSVLDIDTNHLNQNQQLLYKLYTDIPPRRIMDYQLLRYTINENPDQNFNWIVFKNSIPVRLIVNKFKTVKTYGTYTYDIPTKLGKQWSTNIDYRDNSFVFNNKKLQGLSQGEFSKLVIKVFNGLSLNDLRHIYITNFMSKKRSIEDIKQKAYAMGTSKEELERYNKVDL